jgi:hypothetical protein
MTPCKLGFIVFHVGGNGNIPTVQFTSLIPKFDKFRVIVYRIRGKAYLNQSLLWINNSENIGNSGGVLPY